MSYFSSAHSVCGGSKRKPTVWGVLSLSLSLSRRYLERSTEIHRVDVPRRSRRSILYQSGLERETFTCVDVLQTFLRRSNSLSQKRTRTVGSLFFPLGARTHLPLPHKTVGSLFRVPAEPHLQAFGREWGSIVRRLTHGLGGTSDLSLK
jgi:hypothetical protein